MNKGIAEQTFIFIFALIVAAMIMVWGFSTINDLKKRTGQVQLADAIEDIKEKAVTYYNLEDGSSSRINLRFPAGIECVCFKNIHPGIRGSGSMVCDKGACSSGSLMNEKCDSKDNLIDSRLTSNTGNFNIFVTPSSSLYKVTQFSALKELVPADQSDNKLEALCFKTYQGRINALIESKGDHVIIKL